MDHDKPLSLSPRVSAGQRVRDAEGLLSYRLPGEGTRCLQGTKAEAKDSSESRKRRPAQACWGHEASRSPPVLLGDRGQQAWIPPVLGHRGQQAWIPRAVAKNPFQSRIFSPDKATAKHIKFTSHEPFYRNKRYFVKRLRRGKLPHHLITKIANPPQEIIFEDV